MGESYIFGGWKAYACIDILWLIVAYIALQRLRWTQSPNILLSNDTLEISFSTKLHRHLGTLFISIIALTQCISLFYSIPSNIPTSNDFGVAILTSFTFILSLTANLSENNKKLSIGYHLRIGFLISCLLIGISWYGCLYVLTEQYEGNHLFHHLNNNLDFITLSISLVFSIALSIISLTISGNQLEDGNEIYFSAVPNNSLHHHHPINPLSSIEINENYHHSHPSPSSPPPTSFEEQKPDQEKEEDIENGPECLEPYASIYSLLSFSWVEIILKQGLIQPLEMKNIFELVKFDTCEYNAKIVESAWYYNINKEFTKNITNSQSNHKTQSKDQCFTLFYALFVTAYRNRYLNLAFLRFLGILATYGQPLVLNQIIRSVDEGKETGIHLMRMVGFSLALFALNFASALLDASYSYGIQRLATQLRIGLMRLLFTKARHLSNRERNERGIGAIVSHLQMDTRILSQGVVYMNMLWGVPFQLAICLYLLYQQLGIAAFAGAGVSLVVAPMIFAAARLQRLFRRQVMKCRDKRVKFLTEILQGAKTVKLFAWETKVRDEIATKRSNEVSAIFRTQMMGAIAQFLTLSLPSLVCIASFATFTALRGSDSLTPERAFTSLALLGLLSSALGQIPSVLTSLIGMQVSGERIENFLRAEEYSETLITDLSHISQVIKEHDLNNNVSNQGLSMLFRHTDIDTSSLLDNDVENSNRGLSMDRIKQLHRLENDMLNPLHQHPLHQHLHQQSFSIFHNDYLNSFLDLTRSNSEFLLINDQTLSICQYNNQINQHYHQEKNYGKYYRYIETEAQLRYQTCFLADGNQNSMIAIKSANFQWPNAVSTEDELSADLQHKKKKEIMKKKHSQLQKSMKSISKKRTNSSSMSISLLDGEVETLHSYQSESESESEVEYVNKSYVLKDVNLNIDKGSLVGIIGSVGSGKSSLLYGLLNELPSLTDYSDWFDCIQELGGRGGGRELEAQNTRQAARVACCGKFAFCSQEPWILNQTVRENILFGDDFDAVRYNAVVEACALKTDFEAMIDGDNSEIGERGLNLSGGQKARVALARALYSRADVYLLDDILAAVDRHTALHLLNAVLLPPHGLLSGPGNPDWPTRTVILATNQTDWLVHAHKVVILGENRILAQGSYEELVDKGIDPLKLFTEHDEKDDKSASVIEEINIGENRKETNDLNTKPVDDIFNESISSFRSPNTNLKQQIQKVNHEENNVTSGGDGSVLSPSSTSSNNNGGALIGAEQRVRGALNQRIWLGYVKALGYRGCFLVLFLYCCSEGLRTTGDFVLAKWTDSADDHHNDDDVVVVESEDLDIKSHLRKLLSNEKLFTMNTNQSILGLEFHLFFYSTLLLLSCFIVLLRAIALVFANVRACSRVHDAALWAVLRSPMDFFDTTTSGRVLNRFSSDQQLVDIQLRNQMASLLNSALQMISGLVVVLASTPLVILVLLPLAYLYYGIQFKYRTSAREVQRLLSISRSPIFQKTGELVSGLSTVRAFRKGEDLEKKFVFLVDKLARNIRAANTLRRWLALRLEVFGAFVVLAVALSAVVTEVVTGKHANAALVGLSLSYALKVTGYLNGFLTSLSDAELGLVSLERLQQFANLPPEPPLTYPTDSSSSPSSSLTPPSPMNPMNYPPSSRFLYVQGGQLEQPLLVETETTSSSSPPNTLLPLRDPNAPWPSHGEIVFEHVSMSYREGLPNVLNDLSFKVAPGEKVGIVGYRTTRTGSGKSSLLVGLFRLPISGLNQGRILIDGVDIASVGIHTLRANMMIIPQDPVLFSGTLRGNLDPFRDHEDFELLEALHSVGLLEFLIERQRLLMITMKTSSGKDDSSIHHDPVFRKEDLLSLSLKARNTFNNDDLGLNQQGRYVSGGGINSIDSMLDDNQIDESNKSGRIKEKDKPSDGGDSFLMDRTSSLYITAADALSLPIEAYGENLSVGQRQLLCIARGLLKKCKIAVLDEATAAIDRATDEQIQRTLSLCLKNATVLTIAHRIGTVLKSDKIMVMDNGASIEFDSPDRLLARPNSSFAQLWNAVSKSSNMESGT